MRKLVDGAVYVFIRWPEDGERYRYDVGADGTGRLVNLDGDGDYLIRADGTILAAPGHRVGSVCADLEAAG